MRLDLLDTTSWEEVVDAVAEAAANAKPGQWIVGRGWHQDKWSALLSPASAAFRPTPRSISCPYNPVLLRHASGHASFVNARAMALADITRTTPDPPGGEF